MPEDSENQPNHDDRAEAIPPSPEGAEETVPAQREERPTPIGEYDEWRSRELATLLTEDRERVRQMHETLTRQFSDMLTALQGGGIAEDPFRKKREEYRNKYGEEYNPDLWEVGDAFHRLSDSYYSTHDAEYRTYTPVTRLATMRDLSGRMTAAIPGVTERLARIAHEEAAVPSQKEAIMQALEDETARSSLGRALHWGKRAALQRKLQELAWEQKRLADQRKHDEDRLKECQEAPEKLFRLRGEIVNGLLDQAAEQLCAAATERAQQLAAQPDVLAAFNDAVFEDAESKLSQLAASGTIAPEQVPKYLALFRESVAYESATNHIEHYAQQRGQAAEERLAHVHALNRRHYDLPRAVKAVFEEYEMYGSRLVVPDTYWTRWLALLVREQAKELFSQHVTAVAPAAGDLEVQFAQAAGKAVAKGDRSHSALDMTDGTVYPGAPLDVTQVGWDGPDDNYVAQFVGTQGMTVRHALLRQHGLTRELFGSTTMPSLERDIAAQALRVILKTEPHTEGSIQCGMQLFHYRTVETIPLTIANFWREPGFSGEQTFRLIHAPTGRETLAYQYIASLTDDELAALDAQGIPGVRTITDLVRNHPDAVLDHFASHADAEAIRTALADIALHYLEHGTPDEQLFVVRLLGQELTIGEKNIETAVRRLLTSTAEETLPVRYGVVGLAARRSSRREGSTHVVSTLLEAYPSLSADLQESVRRQAAVFVGAFIEHPDAPPAAHRVLAEMLGETPEQLIALLGCIRAVEGAQQAVRYQASQLDVYRAIRDTEGGLDAFLSFSRLGYVFTPGDVQALPVMMEHRKQIEEDLTVIASLAKNYAWYNADSPVKTEPFVDFLDRHVDEVAEIFGTGEALTDHRAVFAERMLAALRRQGSARADAIPPEAVTQFANNTKNFLAAAEKDSPFGGRQRATIVKMLACQPDMAVHCTEFSQRYPLLAGQPDLARTIVNAHDVALRTPQDLALYETVLGRYSKKAVGLVQDFLECRREGAIGPEQNADVLEFLEHLRVLRPTIIKGYLAAKNEGTQELFLAHMRQLAEGMIRNMPMAEAERNDPYYADMVRYVYPNNSGTWTTYEKNAQSADRTSDCAPYKVRERYTIDLRSAVKMEVKEGQAFDEELVNRLQREVTAVQNEFAQDQFDPEKMRLHLDQTLMEHLRGLDTLPGLDVNALQSVEAKLFVALLEGCTRGKGGDAMQRFALLYEFSHFQDIRDFVQGTQDRVRDAETKPYALLAELHTFFADDIKHVFQIVTQKGSEDEAVTRSLPAYFTDLHRRRQAAERQGRLDRLQLDKVGLNEGFLRQLEQVLRQQGGKKGGDFFLVRQGEEGAEIVGPKAAALAKIVEGQQRRTAAALKELTGEDVDPATVHLSTVDLRKFADAERSITEGTFDPELFSAYLTEQFHGIFGTQLAQIQSEMDKFRPAGGGEPARLHGYITKTKESANARMVGGVCVSGDLRQWNMENYLQLVLQDPDDKHCQGLILLHVIEDGGKKILTASYNPSSTYLYTVDERALFRGLTGVLQTFAEENGLDAIAVSRNKTIRTNRTGGEFEKAVDAAISRIRKEHVLQKPEVFSYTPNYQLSELDIVWERKQPS